MERGKNGDRGFFKAVFSSRGTRARKDMPVILKVGYQFEKSVKIKVTPQMAGIVPGAFKKNMR